MFILNLRERPFIRWRDERLSSNAVGWLALCVMVVAASTYNSFAKTLTGSLSPITLVCLSELLTAFFILFSFGMVPMLRKLLAVPNRFLLPLLSVGVLSGLIAPLLWFTGLHGTSAVNAALFGNSEMVFLTFLAVVVLRESFGRIHLLSTITVIAGLVFIVLRGFSEGIHLQGGDVLLALSCFTFASSDIVFRRHLHHVNPQVVILVRSATAIGGFFLLSPFLHMTLVREIELFPLSALPALLGFAFVSRFLNGFSFYEALDRLPVLTVSLGQNITVIGSILFASLYLSEPLQFYHFIGGGLIVAGTLMLELAGIHPSETQLETQLQQSHSHST